MKLIDKDELLKLVDPDEYYHSNEVRDMIDLVPTVAFPPNDPLTLDELREMDGEPYWHIGLRDDSPPAHWAILPSNVAQRPQDYFYGKYWLAYRRKPEEGTIG